MYINYYVYMYQILSCIAGTCTGVVLGLITLDLLQRVFHCKCACSIWDGTPVECSFIYSAISTGIERVSVQSCDHDQNGQGTFLGSNKRSSSVLGHIYSITGNQEAWLNRCACSIKGSRVKIQHGQVLVYHQHIQPNKSDRIVYLQASNRHIPPWQCTTSSVSCLHQRN